MVVPGRKGSVYFFITLGSCLVALAVALNIGWTYLTWRTGLLLVLGLLFFCLIIAGMVLNTIFLVREIRRNEQHDAFINAVTHELKTPVASIRLYLQTLQSRQIDEAKRKEFYQIMLEDSDRLHQTIDQVLRAGSAARSSRLANAARIDLVPMVQDCLAIARNRHHLSPEALNYAYKLPPGETAVVLGDPDELQAAISNLIENAIKYSGSQVRVLVELTKVEPRRVAVRVRDHGVGIPETELKRIFRRFYRVPGSVAIRVKGTGLGLFIVQSVAKKHGGLVFAESEGPGRGSTFTLQLPLISV